jgi:adenosylhomocysteine nucleosidase
MRSLTRRSLVRGGGAFGIATALTHRLPTRVLPAARETRPIGMVVAMEDEFVHLLDHVTQVGEQPSGPLTFQDLEFAGLPIVAVRSGIGSINAAACTERLLTLHQPRSVLNFGSAGAHVRNLMPGDVVIGSATVNQALFVVLPDGTLSFPDADVAAFGEAIAAGRFACDPDLVALAQTRADAWIPAPWPVDLPWPAEVSRRDAMVASGVVASADIWNQDPRRIAFIHATLGSLCEDMEAAAINQVCHAHGVPFLTIKDISNNDLYLPSDLQGDETALPPSQVGARSAALILRLLEGMAG